MKEFNDTYFRANVGALLINKKGEVLAFLRRNHPDAWQFPQGGLEPGEMPLEAIYRELFEETQITKEQLELLSEYPDWLAYELEEEMRSKRNGRGQVQKWFLFCYHGDDSHIDLGKENEFQDWQWTTMTFVLSKIPSFRRCVYTKLNETWRSYLKN